MHRFIRGSSLSEHLRLRVMPVRMVARQQRRREKRPAEIPLSSAGEDDEMCAEKFKGQPELFLYGGLSCVLVYFNFGGFVLRIS